MVSMIAPKNNPIKPLYKNPPIAPKNMTNIGAGAFLPNKIGFKTLSETRVIPIQMARIKAVVVSETENI